MAILASLPGHNLFSSLPTTPQNNRNNLPSHSPPIPVPKYPPKPKSKTLKPNSNPPKTLPKPQSHPSFTKIPHYRTKYHKPISPNGDQIISSSDYEDVDKRAVIIGESGVSYLLPGAPFEFQFRYSETPKAKPLAIREPTFLPFAPPSMPRPWTGKAPLKSKREKEMKKIPLFDSFNPEMEGVKRVEMHGNYKIVEFPKDRRSREEILGEPLSKAEIKAFVKPLLSDNRQEKTGGKIIHRAGGVVYLFHGRNYNYRTRPRYPLMLWKPAAPVYPKLIQDAPEGLTKQEADGLRKKGKKLLAICKLATDSCCNSDQESIGNNLSVILS